MQTRPLCGGKLHREGARQALNPIMTTKGALGFTQLHLPTADWTFFHAESPPSADWNRLKALQMLKATQDEKAYGNGAANSPAPQRPGLPEHGLGTHWTGLL